MKNPASVNSYYGILLISWLCFLHHPVESTGRRSRRQHLCISTASEQAPASASERGSERCNWAIGSDFAAVGSLARSAVAVSTFELHGAVARDEPTTAERPFLGIRRADSGQSCADGGRGSWTVAGQGSTTSLNSRPAS